jgi:hypothetical protein
VYGNYFDTHFLVDPNAEYKAAHELNVCSECHGPLSITGDCLCGEGQCSRYRMRDALQFDDEPPEDDSCPRCQDPVPDDAHAHHQINGRWVPCNGEACSYC